MTTGAKRQMGLYLVEHMEVIEDVTWHEAVEAYVAMRDQRDRARAIAVELEQENTSLLAVLAAERLAVALHLARVSS